MLKTEAMCDAQTLANQSGREQVVYFFVGMTGNGWLEICHDYTNPEAFKNFRCHRIPTPVIVKTVKPHRESRKK